MLIEASDMKKSVSVYQLKPMEIPVSLHVFEKRPTLALSKNALKLAIIGTTFLDVNEEIPS